MRRIAWAVATLWLARTGGASAQGMDVAVAGRVVDAASGEPLARTWVVLAGPAGRASGWTDEGGWYRVRARSPGAYQLWVWRPGYRTLALQVGLYAPGMEQRLDLALEPAPLQVPTLAAPAPSVGPLYRPSHGRLDPQSGRWWAARQRQRAYVPTDVRELTAPAVADAPGAGEADVFRALQRLPGVATRDDYTATLWTRGGSWDQTRVYLDGLPLYNPTHSAWMLSAINADGLGQAVLMPGVRSAEWGEGAAGTLDLRSRSGLARGGGWGGSAEVSLVTARLALDGAGPDGRWAAMGAVRRTYVDAFTAVLSALDSARFPRIPYDFLDAMARVDAQVLGDTWLMGSVYWEEDRLRGDVPNLLVGNRGRWGNRMGQLSLTGRWGAIGWRLQWGQTRYSTLIRRAEPRVSAGREDSVLSLGPLENRVGYDRWQLRLDKDDRWRLGAELAVQSVRYQGPYTPLVAVHQPGVEVEYNDSLRLVHAWAETRQDLTRRLEVGAGLRFEATGERLLDRRWWRLAPRLVARWAVDSATLLSVGWARLHQYTQDIGPTAGPLGPQLHLSHYWVLAGPTRAVLRSDVLTLGGERWWGDWLAAVHVYTRWARGLEVANPEPGPLTDARPLAARGTQSSYGLEVSAQRLRGLWSATVSYTYAVSQMRVGSRRFASPSDVRHRLVAGAARQLGAWRVGASLTAASGVPYTQVFLRDPPELGEPNARRTEPYFSVDLLAEHGRRGRVPWSVYLQLRNVFNRRNALTYTGTYGVCSGPRDAQGQCLVPLRWEDRFQPGLPRLPFVGVRIGG